MKSFTDPITLGQILEYEQPTKYIVKSENYDDSYATPVLTPGQTFILGYTDEKEGIYSDPLPVIIFDDFTTATKLVNFPFKVKSSAMKILKPANKNVYIPYWYYYLSSLKVDNDLHKRYWISTFAPRQVNSPSFTEQKRIAERLDKVQELIALQKEQLTKLDDLIKSRFIDLFGDPITNPKRYNKISLRKACQFINGKAFKPTDWSQQGLPIVRIQNLNNLQAPFNYYDKEVNSKQVIDNGNLLFSWSGTPGTSFGAFIWMRGKAVLNQHIFKVIPVCSFNLAYLQFALNGQLDIIIGKAHGGVGLQHITKQELEKIEILYPSLALQTQFADFVTKIEAQKGLLTTRLSHLETLYKSLMQEYFE